MLVLVCAMDIQTFAIRSLYVQNTVMLFALGIVVSLLLHAIFRKKLINIVVLSLWVFIVFWFFNSAFFGFSQVSVTPNGIQLEYGILSFKNSVLPLDSSWKIETYFGGIRKMKKLYFLKIAEHQSMKVRGSEKLNLLQEIGAAIDEAKSRKSLPKHGKRSGSYLFTLAHELLFAEKHPTLNNNEKDQPRICKLRGTGERSHLLPQTCSTLYSVSKKVHCRM